MATQGSEPTSPLHEIDRKVNRKEKVKIWFKTEIVL